jgi:hypothetical protein
MRSRRSAQAGNLLVPVMLIGLTSTLLMGAVINYSVFIEQASVENQLAETRAYWAIMGHFRYALSRQRHLGFCPDSQGCAANANIKDSDKQTVLQSYLDEISAYRTLTYPEENSSYSIKVNLTAAMDDNPSHHTYSGYMTILGSYPTAGVSTLPVLSGLAQRFAPLQIRFCSSLTSAFQACGGVTNNNNGGSPTGYYSIRRLYRTQSAS